MCITNLKSTFVCRKEKDCMQNLPEKLLKKIQLREKSNILRALPETRNGVDFISNDYLGFSRSAAMFKAAKEVLKTYDIQTNGATGSRLISGNHKLYTVVERELARLHNIEEALLFNSGYDANLGFFSSVPQKGDCVFYDELIHASIRDGMQMSYAETYKFKHNDLQDLEVKYNRLKAKGKINGTVYIVTESVFSMDGDTPDLEMLTSFCESNKCLLIIDEAHAVGVFGKNGTGLIQEKKLEEKVFARIVTFGKGLGCHGAAILGSNALKQYLINFARSLIYTTALPPHALANIWVGYKKLARREDVEALQDNIKFFKAQIKKHKLEAFFIQSDSAIQCCLIPGYSKTKEIAAQLINKGYDVKAIASPTVPKGQERLRFCLHSYNSVQEIEEVLRLLATFV